MALLKDIKLVSSVSGGSITAGALAAAWSDLQCDAAKRAVNLRDRFIAPIPRQSEAAIDYEAITLGLPPWAFLHVAESYRENIAGLRPGLALLASLREDWRVGDPPFSNAGRPFADLESPPTDWLGQTRRVVDITMDQDQALQERILIHAFDDKFRAGALWGLNVRVDGPTGAASIDGNRASAAKAMRTRLNRLSSDEQGLLLKAGCAHAEAGVRNGTPWAPGSMRRPEPPRRRRSEALAARP